MKARYIWLVIGLAFAVTLAVVVGQRLSAEAMAVMIGVVAGVAASIPTSLIVVWFATRTLVAAQPHPPAPVVHSAPPEPRVVVMAPPVAPAGYQNVAGYAAQLPYAPAYPQMPAAAMLAQRQFNVIGGADTMPAEAEPAPELIWQR